jgi:two-component system sensor histidine kinase BaeS
MNNKRNFRSITYKITSVMFLLVMMNVFFLTSYARQRVEGLFRDYLISQTIPITHFGQAEQAFLFSFHQSLIWVGIICLFIGILSSYWVAKSITIPLRKLNIAVENIRKGSLGQKVDISSRDEIGHLANAFNHLTEELIVNQRLRKRLLADIAHELNTPLTVISGNLEGMLCGIVSREDQQLQSIHEEVAHLSKLIGDLKDLSLAEARQLELEIAPIDMKQLLTRIMQTLTPLAEEKGLQLIYKPSLTPIIQGDSNRIHQIFSNLLTNAFRYTLPEGIITISTKELGEKNNRWLAIAIRDTGVGIAEDELPYIFERFYRTSRSRSKKSGGSGIGLAIVKELVEIHDGRVTVESQVGMGSLFTVYLPIRDFN